jgi:hypothetical protein
VSAHIDERAAGIAALPESDAERVAAYQHAQTCARCSAALAEGERLIALLRDMPPLPGPSVAVLQRALQRITEQMDGASSVGRPRAAPQLARRLPLLTATVAALGGSLLAFRIDAIGHALAWKIGIECLFIELVTGAVAVFLVGRPLRQWSPAAGPLFAAVAAWGAFAAQLYLHLRCPMAHEGPHVLVFHVGGVLLAAVLGGLCVKFRASDQAG